MLTIVSAGVLVQGDLVDLDGAVWLVERVETLDDVAVVHLLKLGSVPLNEWAEGLPGRVRVEVLDPRSPLMIRP